MSVNYVDIGDLSQKSSVAGTEKLPVSETEYITPSQINAALTIDSAPKPSSTNALQNGTITTNFIGGTALTPTTSANGIYRTNGEIYSTTTYTYKIFSVTEGESYAFTSVLSGNFTTGYIKAVIWLDSNNSVIGSEKWQNTNNVSTHFVDYLAVAPTGAAKMVLNARNTIDRSGFVKLVAPPHPSCILSTAQTLTTAEKTQARANIGADVENYLPLAGGTMTGDIKMTDGEYINNGSGYAMCGQSGSGTFYSGPGYGISSFLLRSGNVPLTHRKHTSSSAYTDYKIYDASNITISSSEPTSSQGENGDIWIVI